MNSTATILPVLSTTALEETHDRTVAHRIDLPVPLRELFRPDEIPAELLPWLAWALSTDLWDDTWPIEKKRYVVRQWFNLHRFKGTLHGIDEHIHLAGGELKRAIVPPAKTFLMPSLTRDEREAFLARFPQLRIYPYVTRDQAKFGAVSGGGTRGFGLAKTFLGSGPDSENVRSALWPTDWKTFGRYRRTAKLYEPRDGSLTDLTYRTIKRTTVTGVATECEEIVLPARESTQIFPGSGPKARLFFGSGSVAERTVCMEVQRYYEHAIGQPQYHAVLPSLDPISIRPKHVAEQGAAAKGSIFPGEGHSGQFLNAVHLPKSTAWQRLYDTIWLHDKSRLPDERPRTMHLGNIRLGMPAYHAEMTVAIRKTSTKRAVTVGRHATGFLVPYDPAPLEKSRLAIRGSKAKRDKILMKTRTRQRVTFGDRAKFGDGLTFNALIKDL